MRIFFVILLAILCFGLGLELEIPDDVADRTGEMMPNCQGSVWTHSLPSDGYDSAMYITQEFSGEQLLSSKLQLAHTIIGVKNVLNDRMDDPDCTSHLDNFTMNSYHAYDRVPSSDDCDSSMTGIKAMEDAHYAGMMMMMPEEDSSMSMALDDDQMMEFWEDAGHSGGMQMLSGETVPDSMMKSEGFRKKGHHVVVRLDMDRGGSMMMMPEECQATVAVVSCMAEKRHMSRMGVAAVVVVVCVCACCCVGGIAVAVAYVLIKKLRKKREMSAAAAAVDVVPRPPEAEPVHIPQRIMQSQHQDKKADAPTDVQYPQIPVPVPVVYAQDDPEPEFMGNMM